MSNFMRITAEQVHNAYNITGLTPVNGDWGYEDTSTKCGCALTAIAYSQNMNVLFAQLVEEMINSNGQKVGEYPKEYLQGFTHGFDGERKPGSERVGGHYLLGFNDGVSAFKLMKRLGAFLTEERDENNVQVV